MKKLLTFISGISILVLIPFTDCYVPEESERVLDYLFSKCKADAAEPWGYRGDKDTMLQPIVPRVRIYAAATYIDGPNTDNAGSRSETGPKFWGYSYPGCNGRQQSPIALSNMDAVPDYTLAKLAMHNYDVPVSKATVENNGHTIEVTPTDRVQRSILVHGQTYTLRQVHFHWGDAYHHGSEHTLNGYNYALEMHLVHRNANDQIAVVGVFFEEGSKNSPELQKIINKFPEVKYKDARTEMKSKLNLNNLIPSNPSSFYRYAGSLTTPVCSEGVMWSVLTRPLPVGKSQMAEFRKLYSAPKSQASPSCRLINNYRPVQPMNGRTVFLSQ